MATGIERERWVRVLRPGGLLLADHVAAARPPVRGLQRLALGVVERLAARKPIRRVRL